MMSCVKLNSHNLTSNIEDLYPLMLKNVPAFIFNEYRAIIAIIMIIPVYATYTCTWNTYIV